MQTVNIASYRNSESTRFDPLHDERVFISVQVLGNSDAFNRFSQNQSVMHSAAQIKAFPSHYALQALEFVCP